MIDLGIAKHGVPGSRHRDWNCQTGTVVYETKPFCARRRPSLTRTSTFVTLEGWHSLPPANVKAAPSFVWFAAIQGIERKQDLPRLVPKGSFISAKAV